MIEIAWFKTKSFLFKCPGRSLSGSAKYYLCIPGSVILILSSAESFSYKDKNEEDWRKVQNINYATPGSVVNKPRLMVRNSADSKERRCNNV